MCNLKSKAKYTYKSRLLEMTIELEASEDLEDSGRQEKAKLYADILN